MDSLTAILNEYGWWALVALLILRDAGKIAAWVEKALSKIWPSFAEQHRLRLERAMAVDERLVKQQRLELEKEAAAEERISTILAMKNMLKEYRESLKDSIRERRQLQDRLYDLVKRYERLDAQTIEVLRDLSAAIRLQTARLDRVSTKIGVYNHNAETKATKAVQE